MIKSYEMGGTWGRQKMHTKYWFQNSYLFAFIYLTNSMQQSPDKLEVTVW
jgi:hypothetical protein